jgi:hypothetical protein
LSKNEIRSESGRANTAIVTVVTLGLISTIGCSASYPTAPAPTITAVRIHVTSNVWDLIPNSSVQMVAYAIDSDGVYTEVTGQASWSSSDASVLSTQPVQNGRLPIRAVSAGDASLAVNFSGRTDEITLRVFPFPRSSPRIQLGGTPFLPSLAPNRLLVVGVDQFMPGAPSQIVTAGATITSSDPNVAIVDGSTIRPVSPGTVRITATYNGMTATALTSVLPPTASTP